MLAVLLACSSGGSAWATTLIEAWQTGDPGHGTPLVAGARVAYITRQYELAAFDRWTGRVQWRTALLRPSTPANLRLLGAGGTIIAGVEAVQAFDANTGTEVWRVPDLGRYLGIADRDVVVTGSPDGRLVRLDVTNGQARWATHVSDGATVYAPRADAHGGVAAYATPGTAGLVAFDVDTGALHWRRAWPSHPELGDGWGGGPQLSGPIVVMAEADGRLLGVDRGSGEIRWTVPMSDSLPDAPLRRDYRAFAVNAHTLFTSSMDGSVAAYRLSDVGPPVLTWTYRDSRNGSAGFGLTLGARWLWCPFIGGLVAIEPETGREVWRAPRRLSGNALPPASIGTTVMVASAAGLTSFREKGIA